MLEERRNEILRTLVEEYIRSGEPVSSTAICSRADIGVSPATVRNDLAAMERDGYVVQPHTSAGRIPTAQAYRYYVDHLGPSKLRSATQVKITSFFDSVQMELNKLLKATSRLLADVTELPAVVVAPGVLGEKIRDIHLVQLTPTMVLTMVVTEGGRVIQDRIQLSSPVSAGELSDAERLVSADAVGGGIGSTVTLSEDRWAGRPPALREVASGVIDTIRRAAIADSDVFVGGTQQMVAVWEDLSEVQRVLEVVEREAMVLSILARAPGTSIQIGTELPLADMDLAVVSTTFDGGAASGAVGVIGPMRMNYPRVISAVEEVSRVLGDRIHP